MGNLVEQRHKSKPNFRRTSDNNINIYIEYIKENLDIEEKEKKTCKPIIISYVANVRKTRDKVKRRLKILTP